MVVDDECLEGNVQLVEDRVDVVRGDRTVPRVVKVDGERSHTTTNHLVGKERRVTATAHSEDAVELLAPTAGLHLVNQRLEPLLALRPHRILGVHLVVKGAVRA